MTISEESVPEAEQEVQPRDLNKGVILTWIHGGSLRGEFVDSVFNFMARDILGPQHVVGRICVQGPYIPDNRNTVFRHFLEQDLGDWLWSVDVDVTFDTDVLEEMLNVADQDYRPIVGALYFSGAAGDPEDRWWPVWREQQGDVEYAVMPQVRIGEVYENLTSVGMGCTLIHRSVIEAIGANASEEEKRVAWFGHDNFMMDGVHMQMGEDVTFCSRARKLGFPVTGLAYPLGHVKTTTITAQTFTNQFRTDAPDPTTVSEPASPTELASKLILATR